MKLSFVIFLFFNYYNFIQSRKHHLILTNDYRNFLKITSFGFLVGGSLRVDIDRFVFSPFDKNSKFGFTLTRSMKNGLKPDFKVNEICILDGDKHMEDDENVGKISFLLNFDKNQIILRCSKAMSKAEIENGFRDHPLPGLDGRIVRKKREPNLSTISSIVDDHNNNNGIVAENKIILDDISKAHENDRLESEQSLRSQNNQKGTQKISQISKQKNSGSNSLEDEKDKKNHIPTITQTIIQSKSKSGENANSDKNKKSNIQNVSANVIKANENIDVGKFNKNDKEILTDDKKDSDERSNSEILSEENSNLDKKESLFANNICTNDPKIILTQRVVNGEITYAFSFHYHINDESLIGLYSLYLHNCAHSGFISVNMSVKIEEKNRNSYLSAGEMPLPTIYFSLSLLFGFLSVIWISIMRKKERVLRIHYLMGAFVIFKALALFFHSINYHFVGTMGSQIETWAILYYTTHLLKGALLFITILLIGMGWTVVKHILSDKDKRILMIVIPLQVIANIADIIRMESEPGALSYNLYYTMFIIIDLVCCGLILCPIEWSIRHLQQAANCDGKSEESLHKLLLFRRFYIMIACYIYCTRILVFVIDGIIDFRYSYWGTLLSNIGSLILMVAVGKIFIEDSKPIYRRLVQDDDIELEQVLFNLPLNSNTSQNLYYNRKASIKESLIKRDN